MLSAVLGEREREPSGYITDYQRYEHDENVWKVGSLRSTRGRENRERKPIDSCQRYIFRYFFRLSRLLAAHPTVQIDEYASFD